MHQERVETVILPAVSRIKADGHFDIIERTHFFQPNLDNFSKLCGQTQIVPSQHHNVVYSCLLYNLSFPHCIPMIVLISPSFLRLVFAKKIHLRIVHTKAGLAKVLDLPFVSFRIVSWNHRVQGQHGSTPNVGLSENVGLIFPMK